ncbi:MAG TPA: PEP-CTERM sorting domain-containing protein [Candidatus Binatia bacterium]|jgi:hypothetical protein|nr:PEP-CTERM sorting domain-containing protein [Candidatus Binatia bacterium]
MKAITLCATLVGVLTSAANAANITWGSPTKISGPSDVRTVGTYFGSWAPYNGGANASPVNGVTFQGFSDLPNLSSSFDNGYNGFGNPGTSDNNYNSLLQYATFSNNSGANTFGWNGMTSGDTYLVEFWVNDGRNIGQSRSLTLSGGSDSSGFLSYGSDGSGPGQFITGQFVADLSGSETITVTPYSSGPNPSAQVNLFQVRDITVPEPSSLGILAAGAVLFVLRRKSSAT